MWLFSQDAVITDNRIPPGEGKDDKAMIQAGDTVKIIESKRVPWAPDWLGTVISPAREKDHLLVKFDGFGFCGDIVSIHESTLERAETIL